MCKKKLKMKALELSNVKLRGLWQPPSVEDLGSLLVGAQVAVAVFRLPRNMAEPGLEPFLLQFPLLVLLSFFLFFFPVDLLHYPKPYLGQEVLFDVPTLAEEISEDFPVTLVTTLSERKEGIGKGWYQWRKQVPLCRGHHSLCTESSFYAIFTVCPRCFGTQ